LELILGLLKRLKILAQVERIDHNRQEATLELPQGRFSQDLILHIIQVRKFKVQSLENFDRDCLDSDIRMQIFHSKGLYSVMMNILVARSQEVRRIN
jgi:hypothetical protein